MCAQRGVGLGAQEPMAAVMLARDGALEEPSRLVLEDERAGGHGLSM